MALQSGLVYGRLIVSQARQVIRRAGQTQARAPHQSFRLITAYCGFAKDTSSPQPSRKFVYGEDACFVAENKFSNVLGVADGVGGWWDYGIDCSKFSSALMKKCERFVFEGGLSRPPSPTSVIEAGFEEMKEDKMGLFGSSTACVIVLDKDNSILRSANLGDSGFLVVRKGEIVHRSSEQQHYFNTPYQLSLPPPEQEGNVIQDSLDDADKSSVDVEEGDIIIMGTDGLFDNVSTRQILREVDQLKDSTKDSLQHLATSLAEKARRLANDPHYMSPFATQAWKNGIHLRGGKPDDITVLISLVSSAVS